MLPTFMPQESHLKGHIEWVMYWGKVVLGQFTPASDSEMVKQWPSNMLPEIK